LRMPTPDDARASSAIAISGNRHWLERSIM
jgi:hypothetical protein